LDYSKSSIGEKMFYVNGKTVDKLLLHGPSKIFTLGCGQDLGVFLIDQCGCLLKRQEVKDLIAGLTDFLDNTTDEWIEENNNSNLERILRGDNSHIVPIRQKTPENGYVYFVQDDRGRVKIGKSKDIKSRMGEYTKLPFEPKLLHVLKSRDYNTTELLLHEYFADKRIRGEWFSLTKEDIRKVKSRKLPEEIIKSCLEA
jgi:hypothetical protein